MRSDRRVGTPVTAKPAITDNGLIQVSSAFDVATTGDRLVALLKERGLNLFARINHAENAAAVDQDLRPTELFIFGNPAVGTPLMQSSQSIAIDLPQKMLIWQDASEQVWLTYNDPHYLMTRHQLTGCEARLDRISQVLQEMATKATQSS